MVKDTDIIVGYAGEAYSIEFLRKEAKLYSYENASKVKEIFEEIYNNPSDSIYGDEVWVRLSQKGWNRYFVSSLGRVKWLDDNNELVLLKQVDELKEDGTPHYGYLVLIQNNFLEKFSITIMFGDL